MRRITNILATMLCMLLPLSCGNGSEANDNSVTLYTPGNVNADFINALVDGAKKDCGVDINLVFMNCSDRPDQIRLSLLGGVMPADIVFTDFKLPDDVVKDVCLNLISWSHIAASFNYGTLSSCITEDGAVYELPVSSKLIGITYNATLMKEHGWTPPRNFNEMLALKRKCDAARVPFAKSDIRLTGNGFNDLFHLMGSQWISSIEGMEWFDAFTRGEVPADKFEDECGYFRKWVENGLFGELCVDNANGIFARDRALFLFSVMNSVSGADGDQYKTMPWISEDGSNNCFTIYNNCWVMADRKLTAKGNERKLYNVCKVLDYLTSEEFVEATKNLTADGYLSINNYTPGEHQLYRDYLEEIRAGYLQPWFYNDFNQAAIVNTGAEIDSWMIRNYFKDNAPASFTDRCLFSYNPSASFERIFEILEEEEGRRSDNSARVLTTVTETLGLPQTARIAAIGGAMALQQALDAFQGAFPEVQVCMMPHTGTLNGMQPWHAIAAENTILYPGRFMEEYIHVLAPSPGHDFCGILMSGLQIKKLVEAGFDPSGHFIDKDTGRSTFDSEHYGPYPYVCVTKGGLKTDDDGEYLVAISPSALAPHIYEEFLEAGKVLLSPSEGTPFSVEITVGLPLFFAQHPTLAASDIHWE